jgi:hypothetical protein
MIIPPWTLMSSRVSTDGSGKSDWVDMPPS